MELTTIIAAVVTLVLGVLGTFFADKYNEVRKLLKLALEVLEDKEINQEQQDRMIAKLRKIFGRD